MANTNYLNKATKDQLIKTIQKMLKQINPDLELFTFQNEDYLQKIRIRDNNLDTDRYTQIGLIYPSRREEIVTFNYKQAFDQRSSQEKAQLKAINQKIEHLVNRVEKRLMKEGMV